MAEELSAPLRGRKQNRKVGRRLPDLPLARIGLAVLLLLVGVIIGRVLLVQDPEGGKPIAEVPIQSNTRGNSVAEAVASRPASTGDGNTTIVADPQKYPADGPSSARPADIVVASGAPGRTATSIPDLLEETEHGAIPRMSATGQTPFEAYRHAPVGGAGASVALVVVGLGINEAGTLDVISQLPDPVSLAFAPYGRSLPSMVENARRDGHEVLLEIPLEPFDYPQSDPGPQTLVTEQPPRVNLDRLFWLLARFEGYIGVINNMGARFTASAADFSPVMEELGLRGLGYLDDGTSNRSLASQLAQSSTVPFAKASSVIDTNPSADAIRAELEQLESEALRNGSAIGIVTALPVSIRTVAAWARELESKGISLVPASALMNTETTE
ncbi:hypothetical protein GCM10007989_20550 [Devosia pacifica]|uniref:Divergent polysaccharide deacetylase family protein n=1 Tax=Devosia pacifica TaxID=1335967 RepID=A0A918S5A7_9HYPH|nr:divergent polysaccharide deacetylase family protein [Devosia pacifica]GHA24779.1 hypothetical protein GCM10007989_20550 [Devosia pacifica]